jgi:hypothetical protein
MIAFTIVYSLTTWTFSVNTDAHVSTAATVKSDGSTSVETTV